MAELIRQDPGFNVNMELDGQRLTLLHHACARDGSSALIPLLLAHPEQKQKQKNVKDVSRITPFFLLAALDASPVFVRC